MEHAELLVALAPPRAYVRVRGRGSFQVSPALKKFAASIMQRGCRFLVVDLEACEGMDSTFMGVLAGIAMRLRKVGGESGMVVMNLDAKNNTLLRTLGLDNVMELARAPLSDAQRYQYGLLADPESMESLDIKSDDRAATAKTMLTAHQDLIAAEPDNLPRFQDVLAYLKEDIQRHASQDDGVGE